MAWVAGGERCGRLWPAARQKAWDRVWRGIGPAKVRKCHLRTHQWTLKGRRSWNSRRRQAANFFWQAGGPSQRGLNHAVFLWPTFRKAVWPRGYLCLPTPRARRLNYSSPRRGRLALVGRRTQLLDSNRGIFARRRPFRDAENKWGPDSLNQSTIVIPWKHPVRKALLLSNSLPGRGTGLVRTLATSKRPPRMNHGEQCLPPVFKRGTDRLDDLGRKLIGRANRRFDQKKVFAV